MQKRPVDVVVISDVHLGTYACRAKELLVYLQSINPRLLILNGDIIDGWQFSKRYFPSEHMEVIREILQMNASGTRLIYITGNHDEMLRKYTGFQLGSFQITDKVLLEINGKTTWIFHGDVFDHTTHRQAKLLTRLGSNGYAVLLGFNRTVNRMLRFVGRQPISLAANVMKQFNKRIVRIDAFEQLVGDLAIGKGYDHVICGHIHQPKKRVISNDQGSVTYLNSGDWMENRTALEYADNEWALYQQEGPAMNHEPGESTPGRPAVAREMAILFNTLKKRAAL